MLKPGTERDYRPRIASAIEAIPIRKDRTCFVVTVPPSYARLRCGRWRPRRQIRPPGMWAKRRASFIPLWLVIGAGRGRRPS
ncbi:hypothetical protein GCM10011400_37460 [Paraburkholderia caffeinilytica]|uniref:Uncharacterized protein n=1 Tax=Paraburkholderia caffeinilytica TaxID=1761016 RepID=A0ABQ1MUP3_9BURK|nr:hypothetical protein GCM10011400_37460 [Paraburkholderia caffeinilytica]